MKRLFLLLLLLITVTFFTACATTEKSESSKENTTIDSVSDNYIKDWNETAVTYKKDAIPNESIALKVAEAIFAGMEKSEETQKYVPQTVFFDEQDEIWIVSFWEKSNNPNEAVLGGDCKIAMQKKDGKIIHIWFDE